MGEQTLQLLAFNRGLISPLALARVDLKRAAFSAQMMNNWMPRSLGSMMLRPGLNYVGGISGDLPPRMVPFIFKTADTANLEFTQNTLRIWVNDALLARQAVGAVIANGNFNADLTSWTNADQAGATSSWVGSGTGVGYLQLLGTGINSANRDQQVAVFASDLGAEHALRIVVNHGPVSLFVGKTAGGGEFANALVLDTGTHSIAFTPNAASFWIRFQSAKAYKVTVTSCNVEAAGVLSLPSPYQTGDMDNIRAGELTTSGNVVFVGCTGYQQRKIQRWGSQPGNGNRSWSISLYLAEDGPFMDENGGPITIAPSAVNGNITLTASAPLFVASQVGALFQISSVGQFASQAVLGANQFTNAIEVTGVGGDRALAINITNVFVGTVKLQSSITSSTGPFANVAGEGWTAPVATVYNDTLDNQIVWYRLGIAAGDYGSGEADCAISIATGSISGVARITGYTDTTHVAAEVLSALGGVAAVDTWAEGEWSAYRGFPTAAGIYEGRLVWAGNDQTDLSSTDLYNTFLTTNPDGTAVGDSGPIDRSIGFGPVATIQWVLPLQRLLLGGEGSEFSIRSDTLDNALTASNFNIKPASGQGSAPVQAVKVDSNGMFVQRGGTRLFELALSTETFDYAATDLSIYAPEVGGAPGSGTYIKRIGVQRQPDTRIHCVRSDGVVAVLVIDRTENLLCWCLQSTTGVIEDVVVLPSQSGQREDQVYYVVNRTIGGVAKRFLEKWALESDCIGGTLNKQADAMVTFNQAAAVYVPAVAPHLIGQTVVCWHDGKCEESDANGTIQTYVVDGTGGITLNTPATTGIVGLPYIAQWQSNWLGALLAAWRKIDHLGLMLQNTHFRGIYFGDSFSTLDPLPLTQGGAVVAPDTVFAFYPPEPNVFPGNWQVDERLCLQAMAPRPATILAAAVTGDTAT